MAHMRKVETMICFNSKIDKNFQANKLYYMNTKGKASVFCLLEHQNELQIIRPTLFSLCVCVCVFL